MITQEEIYLWMKEHDISVKQILDVVIDSNGIIGVGLISLGDTLKDYIYNHPKRREYKRLDLDTLEKLRREHEHKGNTENQ